MKKKIQKYLAGEREGFSLVELIIVIAIMAILIGVIALAVIPNIGRSRESKDLSTLDNILSSTNVAIANQKVSGSATNVEYADGSGNTVVQAVYDELGAVTLGAGCNTATSATNKIYISYDASDSTSAKITVKAGSSNTGNECAYTKDGDKSVYMKVTN